MNLLLDTHTAIWFVTDSNQLPKSTKQLIENPENHCFISIATLWEMGIKYSLGKLKLKAELNKIFELFFESGLILMPITPDHILTNASLPFKHRDPFDYTNWQRELWDDKTVDEISREAMKHRNRK